MLPSVVITTWRVVADVLKRDLGIFYFVAEVGGLEVALKNKTFVFITFL